MIPAAAITQWGLTRPWPTRDQVEQDLLLARTIIAIYEHPLLKEELVFRGGTCLHQVHLSAPLRYSEDLDFVRTTHRPIGPIIDALREVAQEIGLNVAQVAVGKYPKVKFSAPAASGGPDLRIKVEINTYETSPARPLLDLPFAVASSWFSGACSLQTFTVAELLSTKLRALYQRKKGRDVFDLWLGLDQLGVDPAEIVACFEPYRPSGYTSALAVANLREKLQSPDFVGDLSLLVANPPANYDIDVAVARIEKDLLSKV